jgi:hypothetical protein
MTPHVLSCWIIGDSEQAKDIFGPVTGNEKRHGDWVQRTVAFESEEQAVAAMYTLMPPDNPPVSGIDIRDTTGWSQL